MGMPNSIFNYSQASDIECIYEIPFNEPLHSDVGVIYIKVNQISSKHINHRGGLGFCIDKTAGKMEQLHDTTIKIKQLLCI
jgi:hypothetical protein